MKRRPVVAIACLTALCACSPPQAQHPVETIVAAPIALTVDAQGELQSVQATPLNVPGPQWSKRQLVWMLPEGSRVGKGQVVARFAATQTRLELDQLALDLQRNALSQAGKRQDLATVEGRVDVDLAQVGVDLGIARRFAHAPLTMYARDKVLDAVQDQRLLDHKQSFLDWKRTQSGARGASELAVLDAQRATIALKADTDRKSLAALELSAPHAGVFVLQADWSGQKPQIGATLWAGMDFAKLPDVSQLEVELSLPQLDAQSLHVGDAIRLHPEGHPGQAIASRVSWVADAAQARDQDNPAKYVAFKALVPAAAAARHGWTPGQRFAAQVELRRAKAGITVPNLALIAAGGHDFVDVLAGGRKQRRAVVVGARGVARSEILKGLAPGDRVLLLPTGKAAGA